MRRLFVLEIKRLTKSRMTKILLALSLVLAVVMGMLVISYTEYYYLDEQGKETKITGLEAIEKNKERMKPYEGELTPERIQAIVKANRPLEQKYGENIPQEEYFKTVYPTNWALGLIRQIYYDENGKLKSVGEISDEEAAAFYEKRDEAVAAETAAKYPNSASAREKAAELNSRVEAPLYFVYGYAKSDAADYLLMCLILLGFMCTILAAPAFSADYQSGADDILRCTKNGRLKLAFTKMLTVMLFSAICFCVFIGVYILIVNTAYGWDSLKASFQFSNNNIMAIAPLTAGQGQLLTIGQGFLGLMAAVCLGLFVSSKCRTAMVSVIAGLFLCLLPTILSMIETGGPLQWLICLLPSGGAGILHSFYYELLGNNFLLAGDFSIWQPYAIAIFSAVETPVFFFLAARGYCRHEA